MSPPKWAEGRTSGAYHVGCRTYDAHEFGDTDPDVSVKSATMAILQEAFSDLLPGNILNQDRSDGTVVTVRLPSPCVIESMVSELGKESSFDKTSLRLLANLDSDSDHTRMYTTTTSLYETVTRGKDLSWRYIFGVSVSLRLSRRC